ncbi:hypothetical protein TIFTF001_030236 [Ficus carica]|uniref:CCHC-type domain-containing protein n=1 Tax=Ficus carica TaxID=3494 RepID=A0AA88DX91_FICCA|nr:hypothetical protein TIFTF001_030236 [Ficus carica]
MDNIKAQLKSLTRQIEALKIKESRGIHTIVKAESHEPCFICGGVEHPTQDCPTFREMRGVYEEQCNALEAYKKPTWALIILPQPPKAYFAPQNNTLSMSPLVNTLHMFIEVQSKMNQKFESLFKQMVEESNEMKSQIT